jgi:cyclophilin family peptidyl-prolyl cis-trans isomerase
MIRREFEFLAATIVAVALTLLITLDARATIVRFQTSSGDVDVRLYNSASPNTVANFLSYVTTNRYDGSFIHRVPQTASGGSQNFIVQGGGFLLNNSIWSASAIPAGPLVAAEPGISNLRGTLAATTGIPPSASQWFFNVADNAFLDAQQFTVFGRVLGSGMNTVDTINSLPVVNASAAQNAAGEDFDEVPVRDLNAVFNKQDVTPSEAVMVNVAILNLPPGDYDFDGVVDTADFNVWQSTYGSTLNAAADGNGDGIVNQPDYDIWLSSVPEPSTGFSALLALVAGSLDRPRRAARFRERRL